MATSLDEFAPTRASLIQRLKNWQDQASWQDFFDTYWKLIYKFARRKGLTEIEAQEVVQETMISVSKRMPTFSYDRSTGSFKAWLFHTTRWRITDYLRKRARDPERHSAPAGHGVDWMEGIVDPATKVEDMDADWEKEWEFNLLEAAVAKVKRRIDPEKYQIFYCFVNKGWSVSRVARAFQIPEDQVYLAKHRVSQMIKDETDRLRASMG